MSQDELHNGKLKPIDVPKNLTNKEIITFLQDAGYKFTYDEYPDECYFYDGVLKLGDVYYHEIEHKIVDPYDGIMYSEKHGDIISYVTQFYNGGCCLQEVLEDILEGIDKP